MWAIRFLKAALICSVLMVGLYAALRAESAVKENKAKTDNPTAAANAFLGLSSQELKARNEPKTIVRQHCLHNATSKAYYNCRREALLKGCSEICNTNITGKRAKFFNFVRKHVQCDALWLNEELDAVLDNGQWPPPVFPPAILLDDFRQGGAVKLLKSTPASPKQWQSRVLAPKSSVVHHWTPAVFNSFITLARKNKLQSPDGIEATNSVLQALSKIQVQGKHVLILGDHKPEVPWLQTLVLGLGAAEVWTFDDVRINSTHPQVFALTMAQARKKYLAGSLPKFDVVLAYSAIEHIGLGRHGDALNPWADAQALARAWCVTKGRGQLLLSVSECVDGDQDGKSPDSLQGDTVEFNTRRCYRSAQYTQATANWEQLWRSETIEQPVFILRKVPSRTFPSSSPSP